ncbi:hypothetical protein F4811DRAFT_340472 [Daldinia bambusicola]|nr:hypothetical protein F4811DRAFT_340472 [Daldinia bambusicola]
MMLKSSALFFLSIAFPLATASALPKDNSASDAQCWVGRAYYPCDGYTYGCDAMGIMLKCKTEGNHMITENGCGADYTNNYQGTCHYDANCKAMC